MANWEDVHRYQYVLLEGLQEVGRGGKEDKSRRKDNGKGGEGSHLVIMEESPHPMKRQFIEWEKIFANPVSDISKMYKELVQLNGKNIHNLILK